jgi:hypothetical protein
VPLVYRHGFENAVKVGKKELEPGLVGGERPSCCARLSYEAIEPGRESEPSPI